jgi:hypothetical protein
MAANDPWRTPIVPIRSPSEWVSVPVDTDGRSSVDEDYAAHSTSHIMPANAQYFLADANWELKR